MAGPDGQDDRRLTSLRAAGFHRASSLARRAIVGLVFGLALPAPRTARSADNALTTCAYLLRLPSGLAAQPIGPSVSLPADNGNGAPRSERPGSSSLVAQCRNRRCVRQRSVYRWAALSDLAGVSASIPLVTAKEGPHTASAVSPRVGCGLSQPRNAAYPRFAREGEAPDGSPSSLAGPGRARRKAESANGLKSKQGYRPSPDSASRRSQPAPARSGGSGVDRVPGPASGDHTRGEKPA